ncbi:MAG: 50S ribosomal protein L15 [Flavobacteriales bacterium]|nr:50S ribosomal protein L15 [Flavobacteriales bacterium]
MNLSNLTPAKGSVRDKKRKGRGQGSGKGATSTRGHKGAGSRSGYSKKVGFEGGQMPLQRRVPKVGFKNPFRVEYVGMNLDRLQEFAKSINNDTLTHDVFLKNRIINKKEKIKILGRGALESKLNVSAHAFSDKAKAAIENAGGTTQII